MNLNPILDQPDLISDLTATDMIELTTTASPLVRKEKNLIQGLKGTVLVVGDLHGNFEALLSIIHLWKTKKIDNLVFLGDYVDRGSQQLETINFLLVLKITYPDTVFLLRGNHETPGVNSRYGFASVCVKTFGKGARAMYDRYNDLFSFFSPSLLHGRVLLLHGGIPLGLNTLEELNELPKGDVDADNDILGQILWNDPSDIREGFEPNWERGIHYTFGKKAFGEFVEKHQLTMVIRAHEAFAAGYKYFFENRLLSIFSSPDYFPGSRGKVAAITGEEVTLWNVTV